MSTKVDDPALRIDMRIGRYTVYPYGNNGRQLIIARDGETYLFAAPDLEAAFDRLWKEQTQVRPAPKKRV